MNINIKLKPRHVGCANRAFGSSTKQSVLNTIHSGTLATTLGVWVVGGLCVGSLTNDTFRFYSLEKRRKKVKVLDFPRKPTRQERKDGCLSIKREVIHRTHWVGVYYDIPLSLLKAAGLRAVQHDRFFTLEPLK